MAGKATNEEKWARCLEILKVNVKEQEFKTWFQPIEFVSFSKSTNELLLGVPSNYFYEMLDGQFKRLIYNVVWRGFGKEASIIYRIQTDSTNNIVTEVEGSSGAVQKERINPKNKTLPPTTEPEQEDFDSHLNTEYTFSNFIEGECNKLPRSVGQSIAENPKQTTFNPLFIYGGSGVGKTHLVNAIGTRIRALFPEKRVLYIGAHQFMVQFTESRRMNKFNDFINFYQTIDTLIIDDVQEMAGQTATQMAFFHIFNHLKMNNKQIILTSDQVPSSMQGMEERLITRFNWGLTAELGRPNQELCRKILLCKIHHDGLEIPEDVVDYIASNVNGNVRDLEGIVNSLMANTIFYNRSIDLVMAEQSVSRVIRVKRNTREITIEAILEATCQQWDVSEEEVFSKSRKANIVTVRQTAMYLAQKLTKITTSKIGIHIGGRNHATVLHSIKQVNDRMSTDRSYEKTVNEIEKLLKKG